MDFNEEEFKDLKFDMKSFKDAKIPWQTRFLLKFWPSAGMKRLAEDFGMSSELSAPAHKLFEKVSKVDIIPSTSGQRGFILVLDRTTALYFYQDGDHFAYDGFEVGDYDKGDITIFDNKK